VWFNKLINLGNFINGFTNQSIRKILYPNNSYDKKIRNKVTRILAKLRSHKLIKKIPHSFKYTTTTKGIKIITGILEIKTINLV
jgi:hypothetical protein